MKLTKEEAMYMAKALGDRKLLKAVIRHYEKDKPKGKGFAPVPAEVLFAVEKAKRAGIEGSLVAIENRIVLINGYVTITTVYPPMLDVKFPSIQKWELPSSEKDLVSAFLEAITHEDGIITEPHKFEGSSPEFWAEKSAELWSDPSDVDVLFPLSISNP